MGMEQTVTFPGGSPPPWSAVRDLLVSRGLPMQVRMIDGELAGAHHRRRETQKVVVVRIVAGRVHAMLQRLRTLERRLVGVHRVFIDFDGVRVSATQVFNTAQALLAARAGASSVVTAVDRLDASGHDGVTTIAGLRAAFDASDAECDVIALHATSPAQFGACAVAGANIVDAQIFTTTDGRALDTI